MFYRYNNLFNMFMTTNQVHMRGEWGLNQGCPGEKSVLKKLDKPDSLHGALFNMLVKFNV